MSALPRPPGAAGRDVLLEATGLEREYRMGPEVVRVLRGVTLAVGPGEQRVLRS